METQFLLTDAQVLESIQSLEQETSAEAMQSDNVRHDHEEANEDGLDCFCQVFVRPSILTAKPFSGCYIQQTGGDLIFCDGGCKKWLHVWSIIYIYFRSRLPV